MMGNQQGRFRFDGAEFVVAVLGFFYFLGGFSHTPSHLRTDEREPVTVVMKPKENGEGQEMRVIISGDFQERVFRGVADALQEHAGKDSDVYRARGGRPQLFSEAGNDEVRAAFETVVQVEGETLGIDQKVIDALAEKGFNPTDLKAGKFYIYQ